MTHPQSRLNPLWKRLWDIDRPTSPTALDVYAIARALGFDARLERWVDAAWGALDQLAPAQVYELTRRRLCIPSSREPELVAALDDEATIERTPYELVTIWWDVDSVGLQ